MKPRTDAKPPDDRNRLITPAELAPWLHISQRSALELCRERNRAKQKIPIPLVRLSNRQVRLNREAVERWLERLQASQ